MNRYKIPIQADLLIDRLSKEGSGLGECYTACGKNLSVEVPFGLKGETVQVEILGRERGRGQARLLNVLTPSPERVVPLCPHFGECGGCQWQHMDYTQQLLEKEGRVKALFSSYLTGDAAFYPILPAHPHWRYRNKMELSFASDKAGRRYLGFMLHRGRGKVVNVTSCWLAAPWFTDAVNTVRKWWEGTSLNAYKPHQNRGTLRTLILRGSERSGDRLAMLTVSGNPEDAIHRDQLSALVDALRRSIEPSDSAQRLSIFLRIQQTAKGRPTQFYEMLLYGPDHIREVLNLSPTESLTCRISPSAFFQPNTFQAENLYRRILEMAEISSHALVYDLYCGTGTIALCVAKRAGRVVGVELSPESVLDAQENIKANQVENLQIHKGDVSSVLTRLMMDSDYPDIVTIDPPRAGIDPKTLSQLIEMSPKKIVYVSCNPATQADNLKDLAAAGYQVRGVQPVDQFPHTVHVENIVLLQKTSFC